jgi:hypothetical protein
LSKEVFFTINSDTGKSVQSIKELEDVIKSLRKSWKETDDVFERNKIGESLKNAKEELKTFNDTLRSGESFTDRLAKAIKVGMQDIVLNTKKAEDELTKLNKQQQKLAEEISKTNDVAHKNDLISQFKKLQVQIDSTNGEIKNLNSTLEKGLGENKTAFDKFGDSIKESVKGIGLAVVGAFALDKVIEFGKQCVESFHEAEVNALKLKTAVGVNGGLGSDFQELIEQSEQLQDDTIFSDDAVQQVQTLGLQFGLTSKQVKDILPVIDDFASGTGQDLTSAMESFLRGVEGSGKGLKLYGIDIDSTKSKSELLADITDKLNDKFKGQGKLLGESQAGEAEKFKNKIDDIKEGIGSFISELGNAGIGISNFILNGFRPLNDESENFSKNLFKNAKDLQNFGLAALTAQINLLKNAINTTEGDTSRLEEQLKKLNEQKVNIEISGLSDKELKTRIDNLKSVKFLMKEQSDELKILEDNYAKRVKENNLLDEQANSNKIDRDKKALEERKKLIEQELKDVQARNNINEINSGDQGSKERIEAEKNSLKQLQQFYKENEKELIATKVNSAEEIKQINAKLNEDIKNKDKQLGQIQLDQQSKFNTEFKNYITQSKKNVLEAKRNEINEKLLLVKKGTEEEKKLLDELNEVETNLSKVAIQTRIDELSHKGVLNQQELAEYEQLINQKNALDVQRSQFKKNQDQQDLEDQKKITDALYDTFSNLSNNIIQRIVENSQQSTDAQIQDVHDKLQVELDALDIQQQKEEGTYVERTETQKKFDEKRKKLREKAAEEERQLKIAAFKKEKEAAIVQSIINTLIGVAKALGSSPPPLNIVMAAITAFAGAANTALIASQPVPNFEYGGINQGGLFDGPSHSSGGIPLTNHSGHKVGEVEGGEAIINKRSTKMFGSLLSDINVAGGGRPFFPSMNRSYDTGRSFSLKPKFDFGGITPTSNNGEFEGLKQSIDNLASRTSEPVRAYVMEQDITTSQSQAAIVQRRSELVQ